MKISSTTVSSKAIKGLSAYLSSVPNPTITLATRMVTVMKFENHACASSTAHHRAKTRYHLEN